MEFLRILPSNKIDSSKMHEIAILISSKSENPFIHLSISIIRESRFVKILILCENYIYIKLYKKYIKNNI